MNKKQKLALGRIIAALLLLVAAVLLPLSGIWRLLAFLVPYAVIGWDVLWRALRNILHGQVFDENFLMSIATVGAFFISEYPEAVAVMLFYQVGEWFQSFAVEKSVRAIADLMAIRPDYANVEMDGQLVQVDPETVQVGQIIVIKPGEKVPLDGVVVAGSSRLDTAALTGEPVPRKAEPGDAVISGCINLSGLLRVEVSAVFGESTVTKILDLVENAAASKSKAENFITRFARYYTPAVVAAAVLIFLIPSLLQGNWSEWLYRALVFLVISCPCALVVSVPLSFFGGIGAASRNGILIKGANYLEALSRSKIAVFDKTGTLTEGRFAVQEVQAVGMSEAELLAYAAAAERYVDHPIAASLKEAAADSADLLEVGEVTEQAGQGVRALVAGRQVAAGNAKLMASLGLDVPQPSAPGTVVLVAIDGVYAGQILIADRIRSEAADVIAQLEAQGVRRQVMLTGDRAAAAKQIAEQLALPEYQSDLLPGDKVVAVEGLLASKEKGETLLFLGDGINDAPVLARADVGVAMGGLGSAAAIEAADVVLMNDSLEKLPQAIRISRRTMRVVWQNIIFSLLVKGVVMALGGFGLADLWWAVFADVGVCVIAILNAARALRFR